MKPVALIFSDEQMVEALQRIGYEVKLEEEEFRTERVGNQDVYGLRKVWNVYDKGEALFVWAGPGISRVEFVFKRELENRLLGLFSFSGKIL